MNVCVRARCSKVISVHTWTLPHSVVLAVCVSVHVCGVCVCVCGV